MSENYDSKEDSLDKMSPLLDDNHEIKKPNAIDNDNDNENISDTSNSSNTQNDLKNQNNRFEFNEDIQDKIDDFEKKSNYVFIEKIKKSKDINLKKDSKNRSKSVKKEYHTQKAEKNKINKKAIKKEKKDVINKNIIKTKEEEFNYLSKDSSKEDNKVININSKINLNKEINKTKLLKNHDYDDNKKNNKIEDKTKELSNNNYEITINNYITKGYFKKENVEYQKTIGFNNIGNTCYINSFLQILFHTPNFLKELIEINEEKNLNNNLINSLISLSEDPKNDEFIRNIKLLMGKSDNSFGEYCQNDSQEFGISLLVEIINIIKGNKSFSEENIIEYEITPDNQKDYTIKLFEDYKNKYFKEELLLENMFQIHETFIKIEFEKGIKKIKHIDFNNSFNIELSFPNNQRNKDFDLIELLESKYCYSTSNEKESSENIELEINMHENNSISYEESQLKEQNTKENNKRENKCCLFEICKNIFFSVINFFKNLICKNQKENNEEKKKIKQLKTKNYKYISKLASLPKILIISINRAIFKKELYNNLLKYEDILDVSKFIDKNIYNTNKSIEYKLYAINECSGNSVNSGHYYSYIKIKDKWYKFNDSSVNEQTPRFYSKNVVGLYYIKK